LHPDERQELLGDLTEQFQRRVETHGARTARWWFWREALSLGWGFSWHRRDVISTAHERSRGHWLLWNAASDWRYAWRALWGARGATVVALLTLTLGLGLSTAVFSLTNSLLLRPLPYPSADRLVRLAEAQRPGGPLAASAAAVMPPAGGRLSDTAAGVFIASATTLEAVTPYATGTRVVTTPAATEQRPYAEVGPAFFDVLGVTPRLGRLFVREDGRRESPAAVVLSERFWREALGSREDVVGSSITISDTPHLVLGVARGAITFPAPDIDVWIAGRWRWPAPGIQRNVATSVAVIARLAPDATLDSASLEARQLAAQMAAADPGFLDGVDVPVPQFRIRHLQEDLVHPVRPALLALSAGMALVLLAAAANLINLVLARSTARHREMAVRLTLGAGRWRIVRPLLFEQLLLSGMGAAAGVALAIGLLHVAPAVAPASLARLVEVQFDVWSLAFAAIVALVIGVVVGLLPVWHLPGANLRDLSSSGRTLVGRQAMSAETVRRVLVAGQVALAMILLVGASLLGRTLWSLTHVNPGYRGEHALVFQLGTPGDMFRDPDRQAAFYDTLLARVAQHPDVVVAGATSTLPLGRVGLSGSVGIEGRPRPATAADWPMANKIIVTPGYLEAVGTRVVRGRGFTAADSATSEPVALIDEAMARKYFDGQDPIGQRLDFIRQMRRIVGIVESIKQTDVTAAADPATYYPSTQMVASIAFNPTTGGVAVRTTGDPMDVVPHIRTALKAIDPAIPMYAVARLEDRLSDTFAAPRFYSLALGLFATLALIVAVLGVFGVLSYTVERRQVEFGVRRALGGDERHILRLVLAHATACVAAGVVGGVIAAALGAGLLQSLLFGVDASDPATYLAAGLVVWVVALAAAAVPAIRAMRIDPARTLRAD
jgi:putative ABC transport system permease protein